MSNNPTEFHKIPKVMVFRNITWQHKNCAAEIKNLTSLQFWFKKKTNNKQLSMQSDAIQSTFEKLK